MNNLVTKLTIAAFLSLTIASGGTAIHLAAQPTLTEQQDRLFESSLVVWTTCVTIMPTLLTSRSTDNNEQNR
ncbi:hypothetical protein IQ260_07930 [Leptolyngbya cf. ectocarpi LEGE 11479]|uniref:Uncharacterized protein n=1 Tax=Leptolyngbya cf. ectocarpi LEGE 11479 TaxID=1828722 RepID=A0A928X054_LEPEC|nr:hypothetical protein [Leptolyngbya ectocarpi]MBE9066579.1 hypothetical protein [Leptolyngbya cf. ectocarpi LEGE 11479]